MWFADGSLIINSKNLKRVKKLKNGLHNTYHEKSEKRIREAFEVKNGKIHGKYIFYKSDGQKQYEIEYANGMKHGKALQFFVRNKYGSMSTENILRAKGIFNFGNPIGDFEHYDDEGNLVMTRKYFRNGYGNIMSSRKYHEVQSKSKSQIGKET